jgi:hypothetical protein
MASILQLNLLKTLYICSQHHPTDSIFNRCHWFSRIIESCEKLKGYKLLENKAGRTAMANQTLPQSEKLKLLLKGKI